MIFVTLGTNDKSFGRLLDSVEKAAADGLLSGEILVQSGYTKYESSRMKVVESMNRQEFEEAVAKADLVITHGGVGSIMTALQHGKTILAAARLAAYGEHVNDHQIQLLESFDRDGYLIYMKDLSDLAPYLERAKTFTPRQYVSNTAAMVSFLEDWIEKN